MCSSCENKIDMKYIGKVKFKALPKGCQYLSKYESYQYTINQDKIRDLVTKEIKDRLDQKKRILIAFPKSDLIKGIYSNRLIRFERVESEINFVFIYSMPEKFRYHLIP